MVDTSREDGRKACRIVYCGPSQSGKTTNLEALERAFPAHTRGQLLRLATETERTLYFDRLMIDLGGSQGNHPGGCVELFTVPGQSFYLAARRRVLRDADGIVFVADSRRERLALNIEALGEVVAAIEDAGRDVAEIPSVLQLNKRDAITAMKRDELLKALNCVGEPCIEAVAHEGRGVVETLRLVARRALSRRASPTASV